MHSPESRTAATLQPEKLEQVYRAWDDAIEEGDISRLVDLYAPDAEIESPLIYEFTEWKTGLLRGRDAFRPLYEEVARRQSKVVRPRHHDNYVIKGRSIIWEYSRLSTQGEQSEFVESWDFNADYQIERHRVYWGWSRITALAQKGFSRSAR